MGASPEHFGRPRRVDHLRSGVRDQPGLDGETLPLLKIQKLARRSGGVHLIILFFDVEIGSHSDTQAEVPWALSRLTATSISQAQATPDFSLANTGFHHVAQASSSDPSASASQSAGTAGMSHHTSLDHTSTYLKTDLTLLPRLKYSGAISVHCSLCLPGSRDSRASASQVETGFHRVGQAGLELLTSGYPPASAPQSAEITGMSHCAWPNSFKKKNSSCPPQPSKVLGLQSSHLFTELQKFSWVIRTNHE
ncbi:hypothetical protein AAY473_014286 [Plecturocebus cupreus]